MEKFNWKRFWMVFKCDFAKIRTVYIAFAVLAVCTTVIAVALMRILEHTSWHHILRIVCNASNGFMFVGLIFTAMMFIFGGDNKTLIPEILLPASTAEKFWAKFAVYWLLPALFAFAMVRIAPYYNLPDGADVSWRGVRILFCIYLCLSGIMLLGSAVFFKHAAVKTFGTFVGIVTFVSLMMINFGKNLSLPDFLQTFGDYIAEENYRITIFQLVLGFSVVAVCTAIAYQKFKRLTLK